MLAHAIGRQPASISALALLTGGEGTSSRERAALLPASCRESHRAVELRVKGSMIHPRTPATARLTPDTRAPLGNFRPSPSRARGAACAPGARASAAESATSVGCRVAVPPRAVAIQPTSRNPFRSPSSFFRFNGLLERALSESAARESMALTGRTSAHRRQSFLRLEQRRSKKTKMGAASSDSGRKPAWGRQVAATISAPAQKIQ